jgi:sec-independent protein translocase protein TatA
MLGGSTEVMGLDNPLHLAFLLVLLLLVFGARRLPEIGRSLGSGMRGFRDALSGEGKQQSLESEPAQGPVPVELPRQAPAASPPGEERSVA